LGKSENSKVSHTKVSVEEFPWYESARTRFRANKLVEDDDDDVLEEETKRFVDVGDRNDDRNDDAGSCCRFCFTLAATVD
jgi:hypothetical protein